MMLKGRRSSKLGWRANFQTQLWTPQTYPGTYTPWLGDTLWVPGQPGPLCGFVFTTASPMLLGREWSRSETSGSGTRILGSTLANQGHITLATLVEAIFE